MPKIKQFLTNARQSFEVICDGFVPLRINAGKVANYSLPGNEITGIALYTAGKSRLNSSTDQVSIQKTGNLALRSCIIIENVFIYSTDKIYIQGNKSIHKHYKGLRYKND